MEDHGKLVQSIKQIRKLMVVITLVFVAMAGILVYLMVDPTLSIFKSKEPSQEFVTVPGVDEEDFDKIWHTCKNRAYRRRGVDGGSQ